MGRRARRTAMALTAVMGVAGASLAAFEGCDLEQNGLGPPVNPDAAFTLDAPAIPDATLDSAVVDTGAPDVQPDTKSTGPDACAPIETDCLDGIDNDCNGLTDCADPACTAGYTCAPQPSAGFAGYAVYESDRATACPPAYPTQTDTFETLIFTPATCSPCGCDGQGATCGSATLTCSSGPGCSSPDGGVSAVLGGGACTELDAAAPIGPGGSCTLSVPSATPGTCAANGGAASVPPVSFGTLSRVCSTPPDAGVGGGCTSGAVCVAKAPSGAQGVCISIAISGSAECPSGYSSAHATMPNATSYDDTRGCTMCTCAGPFDAGCSGVAALYPAAGCGGPDAGAPVSLPADGVCHGGPGGPGGPGALGSASLDASIASQGTCVPSGGAVTGQVVPTHETLYCCQN